MKFLAETGGGKHEVEIVLEGERLLACCDGRRYDLEASQPEGGVYLFKTNGRIFEAVVSSQEDLNDPIFIRIGKEEHEVRITDPKRLRVGESTDENSSGRAEIRTAMPGKVVRLLVAIGEAVQKGDGIVVVEAMKMQNEMRSPKDGIVSEIKVAEGNTVKAGDVLVTIE